MNKYLFSLLLSLNSALATFAQIGPSPKREFRGVWIATVNNMDWPSKENTDPKKQKEELIALLDAHQKMGVNAIMLQVRPIADALYGKSKEPWSRFLTGQQGKAPKPYYDPLKLAIKEAHERGMELHAWFNPYRATYDLIDSNTHAKHITRQKPDWFFTYEGKKWFNPGIPEVQSYIVEVILNVVRNYEIDGVHFDDYFYPYPKESFPQRPVFLVDQETYKKYNTQFDSIEDWRRNNVDILVQRLSGSIRAVKKDVKFGISPFGIWRNRWQDPFGSESNGFDGYSRLYADARKWAQMGWIDYINPQIYWSFYYKPAPYEKLVDWWSQNSFGKHLYIGMAAYKANLTKQGWEDRRQIPNQIRYLRENPKAQGSVFFSSKSLTDNLGGVADSLLNDFYKYPALPPTMAWKDTIAPYAPRRLTIKSRGSAGAELRWQAQSVGKNAIKGYVVYRFKRSEDMLALSSKNILKVSFNPKRKSFIDKTASKDQFYLYVVTALDQLKNESIASNMVTLGVPEVIELAEIK